MRGTQPRRKHLVRPASIAVAEHASHGLARRAVDGSDIARLHAGGL